VTFSLGTHVMFSLRGAVPRIETPGFVIHPDVDMLYIPGYDLSSFAGGFPSLLGSVNAVGRIRTIAVDLSIRPDTPFTHMFRNGLHEWTSLELIMLVVTHDDPMHGGPFRFGKLKIEDFIPENQRVSFVITLKLLQLIFSRDYGTIIPQIVCVEKKYIE
jgi:hypothetical protein